MWFFQSIWGRLGNFEKRWIDVDSGQLIGIIIGIVVVLAIVAVAVMVSRKRKVAADRNRAAEMREQAKADELAAREREAKAARAEADAQQAEVEAERLRQEARSRQEEAEKVRSGAQSNCAKPTNWTPTSSRPSVTGGNGETPTREEFAARDGRRRRQVSASPPPVSPPPAPATFTVKGAIRTTRPEPIRRTPRCRPDRTAKAAKPHPEIGSPRIPEPRSRAAEPARAARSSGGRRTGRALSHWVTWRSLRRVTGPVTWPPVI